MSRPRPTMIRVGQKLIRQAENADGSVLATRIALWAVEDALRQLEEARRGLERRLEAIERIPA